MPDYTLEGVRQRDAVVTWSFAGSNYGGQAANFFGFIVTPAFQQEIYDALGAWSAVTGLTFVQVADTATSEIRFGMGNFDGPSGVLAQASYFYSGEYISPGVIVRFDQGETYAQGPSGMVVAGGLSLEVVAIHEIGHAIGLGHYEGSLAVMNSHLQSGLTRLTASDIHGAQALYGSPAPAYDRAPVLADFNGDGKIDELRLQAAGSTIEVTVSVSTGSSLPNGTVWATGAVTPITTTDLNGDGMFDLVRSDGTGIYAALSTGTGFASWTTWLATSPVATTHWVDLNGDGRTDYAQLAGGVLKAALSTGAAFASLATWATGTSASDQFADLNGDGRADMAQFYNGRQIVALSSGAGFGAWNDWLGGSTSSDRYTDVNGDGRADLLQLYNGRSIVALSTGSGFGPWNDYASGVTASDQFADMNGDGHLDLVQLYRGRQLVALFDGTRAGGWNDWISGGSTASDTLADMNGDGKTDIIQHYSNRTYVALSTGTAFGGWSQWGEYPVSSAAMDGSASLAADASAGAASQFFFEDSFVFQGEPESDPLLFQDWAEAGFASNQSPNVFPELTEAAQSAAQWVEGPVRFADGQAAEDFNGGQMHEYFHDHWLAIV